ncbi:Fimbrial protein [Halioglobus japonicus]|nr:Fimbrial protein [Halioglobus japonicus]
MVGQKTAASGFSLIEVMIVLVIIGVLLLVALPGYQDSMKKTRRADGMRDLMELVSRQERFYAQNSRYTDDINTAAGLNFRHESATDDPTTSSEGHYNLSVVACEGKDADDFDTCYQLRAAPIGTQGTDPCGTLTVDSRGIRGHTGSPGQEVHCW